MEEHEPKQGMNPEEMEYYNYILESLANITDEELETFIKETALTRRRETDGRDVIQEMYTAYTEDEDDLCEEVLKKYVFFHSLTPEELNKLDLFFKKFAYLPGVHSNPTDVRNYKIFILNTEDV